MHTKDKVLDDLAQLAGGTVIMFSGLGRQVREDVKSRIDEMALRLDFVPREEFLATETVLKETRKEHEALKSRVETLENELKKLAKRN